MEIFIGLVMGILISILICLFYLIFRKDIEKGFDKVEKTVKVRKKKGFLVNLPSEIEQQRQEIIERNKKQGLDTKLSDLIPKDDE